MRKYDASVALTTLIIIIAILMSFGITISKTAVDLGYTSRGYVTDSSSRMLARSCLEEVLYKIKEDQALTGTFNLNINDRTCEMLIENGSSADLKNITITQSVDSYTRIEHWEINTSSSPYTFRSLD